MKAVHWAIAGYRVGARWAGPVVMSLVLLAFRVVWGWGFFIAGRGKLMDISKPIGFFTELHIPMPVANAWFISCLECFGGLLLLAGLGSRVIAFLLTCNMIVAYLTTEQEALGALWNDGDPGKFIAAAPFWFMVASVLVLALGPGWFSGDAVLKRFVFGRACCGVKVDSKSTMPALTQQPAMA
ncbi:MAG: DoxX family protein [Phycisphaerae bacterium]